MHFSHPKRRARTRSQTRKCCCLHWRPSLRRVWWSSTLGSTKPSPHISTLLPSTTRRRRRRSFPCLDSGFGKSSISLVWRPQRMAYCKLITILCQLQAGQDPGPCLRHAFPLRLPLRQGQQPRQQRGDTGDCLKVLPTRDMIVQPYLSRIEPMKLVENVLCSLCSWLDGKLLSPQFIIVAFLLKD